MFDVLICWVIIKNNKYNQNIIVVQIYKTKTCTKSHLVSKACNTWRSKIAYYLQDSTAKTVQSLTSNYDTKISVIHSQNTIISHWRSKNVIIL